MHLGKILPQKRNADRRTRKGTECRVMSLFFIPPLWNLADFIYFCICFNLACYAADPNLRFSPVARMHLHAVAMEKETPYIYSRPVLEWMTVCTEFCKFLEQCGNEEPTRFNDVMRGLLPMLYLRTSLLEKTGEEVAGYTEDHVSEDDYNYIEANVRRVTGSQNEYLDVFVEDFKYSDQPVLRTISEDLADCYQAVRNAVEIFREGHEEAMQVAVEEVIDSFRQYWGQRLLNALRALHDARFSDLYE